MNYIHREILNRKKNKFTFSGGFKLIINGENLNVVQIPMMKFVYNISDYEFVSVKIKKNFDMIFYYFFVAMWID